jgi:hypothetical protein
MHSPGTTQSTTRVRLVEAGDSVTHVPHWTGGTPSRCWFDLLRNPDQVDLMDELRGRPALREQIAVLNSPESPLITIACAAAATRLFQTGGPPAWRMSSSVQLAFADPECCDLDRYTSPAQALLDGLGGDPQAARWNRLVELRPDPVEFQAVRRRARSLTIQTAAHGLDGATAVRECGLCVQIQTAAIESWTRLRESGDIGFLTSCHRGWGSRGRTTRTSTSPTRRQWFPS